MNKVRGQRYIEALLGAAGSLLIFLTAAQAAGTLVQIQSNGDVVKTANPLPVTSVGGSGDVVGLAAATTGGATPYSLIATASTNSNLISAGAHTVYDIDVENNSSTIAYLKVYDKATAPTCNSDTPIRRMIVPGNAGGSGFMKQFPLGLAVTLGLGFCLSGGIADNDNTSVAATTFTINFSYK